MTTPFDAYISHLERMDALLSSDKCPRCNRVAVGWPLRRSDICSPKAWALCLRDPSAFSSTRRALSHCRVCGVLTNHTTLEHREAVELQHQPEDSACSCMVCDDLRDEKRAATSQYDGDYHDEGGEA